MEALALLILETEKNLTVYLSNCIFNYVSGWIFISRLQSMDSVSEMTYTVCSLCHSGLGT